MSLVLVTGGTGHLGRDLVDHLVQAGHTVRVFARSRQGRTDVEWAIGDLASGQGLRAALNGVHTVINAATHSPIARRGGFRPIDFFKSPAAVDVEGTARLLGFSHDAGVQHLLHVSIVGLDDATLPYARVKLAGEQLVRQSCVSWSVIRAMPFHYLLADLLSGMTALPVWPIPRATFNPVDTSDVADYLARCAFDGGRGVRAEIGGPDDLSLVEIARQFQVARGLRRVVLPVPLSDKAARGMGFVVSQGVRGTRSWADWLKQAFAQRRSAA
ncbi:SDR family oxidoreductase [Bradyrhizobium viridifuturi]|uniref:SDR family oxidoreductase n=1 Tax=Bradyrhizobium viridifuturi TaxID=1654716 RepID=UPI00067F53BE|nr:NAD(P)H-binding protein [Bradyrhizobium viridifuturi]